MNKKRILSLVVTILIALSLITFAFATESAAAPADAPVEQPWYAGLLSFAPIIIIFAVFYFVLIRPENKRKKETAAMRENIAVGDEIVTIGGIVGKVKTVRDDQIIIETSNQNNKIRLMKWSVSSVNKSAASEVETINEEE